MKTKEELHALKEEFETLNKKLHELTEEELKLVAGGYQINSVDFQEGECYRNIEGFGTYMYKVLHDEHNVALNQKIECNRYEYDKSRGWILNSSPSLNPLSTASHMKTPSELMAMEYLGMNIAVY